MADALVFTNGVDFGSVGNALKTQYDKAFQEHLPWHVELLEWAGASDAITEARDIDGPTIPSRLATGFGVRGGKTWQIGMHTGRGMAAGARAEAVSGQTRPAGLPPENDGSYAQAAVTIAYLYASMRITHPAMKQIKKGTTSWLNALDAAMIDPVMSLIQLIEVYLCGSGTGVLADVTVPGGSFIAAGTAITVTSVRWLAKGQAIDIFSYDGTNWKAMTAGTGGTANADPNDGNPTLIRITSVNPSNNTIKVDKPLHLSYSSGGLIASGIRAVVCNFGDCYVGDTTGALATTGSLYFLGPAGLDQAIDNGTTAASIFQNINRATAGNEYYSSYVASAASGFDQLAHGIRATDEIRFSSGAKPRDLSALCSLRTRRALIGSIENGGLTGPQGSGTSKQRYMGGQVTALEGVLPSISGVPLTEIQMLTDGTLYYADKRDLEIYQTEDAAYDDTDGAVLSRVRKLAAFGAFFFWYMNLKWERPNRGAKIINIPVSGR